MPLVKSETDDTNELEMSLVLGDLLDAQVLLADEESGQAAYDLVVHVDGQPRAYIEIKRRTVPSTHFDLGVIAKNKVDRLVSVGRERGVEPLVVFWYTDQILWIPANRLKVAQVKQLKRFSPRPNGKWASTDRGHDAYYFPIQWLRPLETLADYVSERLARPTGSSLLYRPSGDEVGQDLAEAVRLGD